MDEELAELRAQIIKDSAKKLVVVKLLSNFFNHRDLFAVYIRTKVIHNLFESNKNLDFNKLDLFHVQYTSSLVELFQKLKKSKEQQYLLIADEIHINDDLIHKFENQAGTSNFSQEVKSHSAAMSAKLKELYAVLDSGSASNSFGWGDIMIFSTRMGMEYFREISDEDFLKLTDNEGKKTYQTENATIERKLMGRLNKLNFRVKFICGLRFDGDFVEVFDFVDSNESFLFVNSIKAFYQLDKEAANCLNLTKNISNKQAIIQSLKLKNDVLREKQATLNSTLPNNVEEVLAGYLAKISGVDFLAELQNVDEQTNILRAMLNININSK